LTGLFAEDMLLSVAGGMRLVHPGRESNRGSPRALTGIATILLFTAGCGGDGAGGGDTTYQNIAAMTAELEKAGIGCEPVEGFPEPGATQAFCAAEAGEFLDYILYVVSGDADLREQVAESLNVEDVILVGGNWVATEESGNVTLPQLQDVLGGELVDDPADVERG
jgi:hypothetical protein